MHDCASRHVGRPSRISRVVSGLLIALFSLTLLATPLKVVQAAEPPAVAAPSAIAVDVATGKVLFAKDIHHRTAMASTTKIMTALTAISSPGVNLSDRYVVVKQDLVGEASMGLRAGENLSLEELLHGLLINSGNDAAMAIARLVGSKLPGEGDPIDRFVVRMNQQAALLGLRDSHYMNPHGLDQDGHFSSAFDLAISGWYLLKQPTLAKIVATRSITVAGHPLNNLNTLFRRYDGVTGIKPGFTDNAGLCLVASASRAGRSVITVVLNEAQAGYNSDPVALLDYSFAQLAAGADKLQPPAGGGPLPTSEFLGRVTGDRLVTGFEQPILTAANPLEKNGMINASVITGSAQITASPTQSDSSSSSGSSSTSSGGGPSFFVVLLVALLILGVIYLVLRFGVLGEAGRTVAFRVEDYAVAGFGTARRGIGRLFQLLRPGSNGNSDNHDRHDNEADEKPARVAPERPRLTERTSSRDAIADRSPERRGSLPARPASEPDQTLRGQPPRSRDYTYTDETPVPRSTAPRPNINPNTVRPPVNRSQPPTSSEPVNPLDNFFDDVAPFDFEKMDDEIKPAFPPNGTADAPSQPTLRPPSPLNTNPFITPRNQPPALPSHPNRTAAEPLQEPPQSYEYEPVSKPAPRPAQPQPSQADQLASRARQAIDYAYAGRSLASTEEFRKVIEQNHLYDFGGIDGFEQMPVLGYKSLATAYYQAGRGKFAILLLDMAIEKYPNDLELRNLLRTLRRDMAM